MFIAAHSLVKLISEQEEHTLTPYLAVFICCHASTSFDFSKPLQGWWWRGVWAEAEESRSKNGRINGLLLGGWVVKSMRGITGLHCSVPGGW